jgi:hypothetical protein
VLSKKYKGAADVRGNKDPMRTHTYAPTSSSHGGALQKRLDPQEEVKFPKAFVLQRYVLATFVNQTAG